MRKHVANDEFRFYLHTVFELCTYHWPALLPQTFLLICVQQSCRWIVLPHPLVDLLQPESHNECTDDHTSHEASIGRHCGDVSRSVGFRVKVRRKDERCHGDTVHDRKSPSFLLGGLTACGSNPSNDDRVGPGSQP
jgi:hypothetical protein